METAHVYSGLLAFTCAILSAKWAMDLGTSQIGQALWGIAGLLVGPLALLMLYVRLVRGRQALGQPGGRWLRGTPAAPAIGCEKKILAIGHNAAADR